MKRLTLEATDENIYDSIRADSFCRNADVKEFIEMLDTIEGNMFISLDGRWGEGKSFYVRQIEQTLKYITKKKWNENKSDKGDNIEIYFKNTILDSIELDKSYLPIYYNAWIYDNHDDPLMSLLLTIIKKSEQYLETKLNSTIGEKVSALLSAASLTIGKFQFNIDGDRTKKAIEGKDILESVKTSEEIREGVKKILNEVIVENAEKFVIFIDELDRCKPSYAIEMLERIKHYFDDERIIFVVSVNKEQLVHTISKYYGIGFDSTGYLNKFFDLNIHMPILKQSSYSLFDAYSDRQTNLRNIVDGLNDYYKLSIRDALIFKQRTSNLPVNYINDDSTQGYLLSLFVPIIIILDIKDENEKLKFLNGDGSILEVFSREIKQIHNMVCRFTKGYDRDNQYEEGIKEINEVYKYIFNNKNIDKITELLSKLDCDLKRICIQLCNGFNGWYIGNPNAVKLGRCIKELERIYGIREGSFNEKGNNRIGDINNFNDQSKNVPKTEKELAEQLGITQQTIQNYKKLSEMIPELEELIDTGIVTKDTALAIINNFGRSKNDENKKRKIAVEYVRLCGYKNGEVGNGGKKRVQNGLSKITLDEIAQELNMSKTNLKRALRIERNLTDSMKELLDNGEITKTFASDITNEFKIILDYTCN